MDEVKEEMEEETLKGLCGNSLNTNMACDIKVEPEDSAEEDMNVGLMCSPSNQIPEIQVKDEDGEIATNEVNGIPYSGEQSNGQIKLKIEVEEDEWIGNTTIKEESFYSDNVNDKEHNELSNTPCTSSTNTTILEGLLIQKNINTGIKIEPEKDIGLLSNSEQDKCLEKNGVMEESTVIDKFRVNMAAIESVCKENQASELQELHGLSVYDQATLEAGILRQVDQALEDELETPDNQESAMLLDPEDEETEMERQIRLGEMTPFGTTLGTPSSGIKQKSGLSEIEKYLQKQAEYEKTKKQNVTKSHEKTKAKSKTIPEEARVKTHNTEKTLIKKKVLNKDHKKKKNKKKEVEGTKTEDFVPWSVRPGRVVGERTYTYPDEASGSEYVPSDDSEYQPSSEDQIPVREKVIQKKKTAVGKKRKLKQAKPYKIPEDWASDDSDWEYSDEEGNLKINKRSKKELDDGDVDAFKRRIQLWEREQKQQKVDEERPKYHHLDGEYKVPTEMWEKLYNYQRVGVRWLWELDQQRCGGILGDEMGLGKTIQVIAFLAGLHVSEMKDHDTNYRGLGPTLIVCPTTVMHQWVREFHTWYPPLRVAILHESGTFAGKERSRLIVNMVHARGVLITSYTGATQHKEEMLARNWHYVILDEGHKIRNPDAQITLAVKQLRTSHRIILSGSPMQNNLKELWSLFDFVFPGKLGTLPVFIEQFAVPITQGGYANASQVQVMTAFKCATVLKDTIAPYLLRRMKADVKSHICLPEKNEQVLFCRLTEEQRRFYRGYVESGDVCRILEGRLKIFVGLINLRKICNHPDLYSGGTKVLSGEEDQGEEQRYGYWGKSGKMIVVQTLLQIWKKQGHRVLIFTQSRQMLTIMEAFVQQEGYTYLKLDGNTSIAARQPLINKFNQDSSYFVMLLTTRVGGLGVNLTGANRVLIYDPDWNPATDTQARERAWRIGQTQSVTVYRLITAGTIEEKMYHRQIFKQFLCNKVLKDPRQRRFFKSNDLFELFTLKETDKEGSTETAAIFAGTDSEVLLDPTKTYKHRKVEPRLSAERPTETYSRKKEEKERKTEEKRKESLKKRSSISKNPVSFSDEKIKRMKKLAHMLSQKIVNTKSPEKSDNTAKPEESNLESTEQREEVILISNKGTSHTTGSTVTVSKPSTSKANECTRVSDKAEKKKKRKHKDKKKRHHKDAKFEGETVPYLVKTGEAETKNEDKNGEKEKNYATQDEYVLQKLFARSGLQTAMKHDTIMEGGPADYALVEGEAERVAKQAVEKLKESRRECWRPTTGVPTFTGTNGARNFQKKSGIGKSAEGLSSNELLERIRKRNLNAKAKDSDLELVDDIRHFVSSFGGTVNTNQVVARFEGRLAEGSSPLFKSLLSKICTFYRAPDKLGYWTLKDEFNW